MEAMPIQVTIFIQPSVTFRYKNLKGNWLQLIYKGQKLFLRMHQFKQKKDLFQFQRKIKLIVQMKEFLHFQINNIKNAMNYVKF